jgi:glycosyltransferase involved in cell wall biosynthesis
VTSSGSPIAVVVMAYGIRPTLAAAVASVVSQQPAAEIVVVHSGDGDAREPLARAGLDVRLIRSETRLFPGAARNFGIAATRAPIVAFLADDCIAQPGWIQARLTAHQGGAASVASALLCHRPGNLVALAAHLSLYTRRLPGAAPDLALRYGASYMRTLFDRYGLFREDMEGGEDTEFHMRLQEAEQPVWRPEVQTVHTGAETVGEFLKTQTQRGRRMVQSLNAIGGQKNTAVAKNAIARTRRIVVEALRFMPADQRWRVHLATPLIALGNLAYARGALSGGEGDRD